MVPLFWCCAQTWKLLVRNYFPFLVPQCFSNSKLRDFRLKVHLSSKNANIATTCPFDSSVQPKPLFLFWSDTGTQIGRYRNWYWKHISKGESSYQCKINLALVWGIFFIIKGPHKPNLQANLWRCWLIFKIIKAYTPERSRKKEKIWTFLKKKCFGYRNWTLV